MTASQDLYATSSVVKERIVRGHLVYKVHGSGFLGCLLCALNGFQLEGDIIWLSLRHRSCNSDGPWQTVKCDKRFAVAKEHKSVNREAFCVDCSEPGHYLGPGHYSDPASMNEQAS